MTAKQRWTRVATIIGAFRLAMLVSAVLLTICSLVSFVGLRRTSPVAAASVICGADA